VLEGFENYSVALPARPGRPANDSSTHLKSLAWMRFLLDRLDDVEEWATQAKVVASGAADAACPPAWLAHRRADAAHLQSLFSGGQRPEVPKALVKRTPSLLDAVFGPILGGASGGAGRYFSDRVLRGIQRPDEVRLAWMDELVPGSRRAFHTVPSGMDAWFYDALDFQSPWYARLFLWRSEDPHFQQVEWEALLDDGSDVGTMPTIAATVRERMYGCWDLTDNDALRFTTEIERAATYAVYPSLLFAPADEFEAARQDVRAAVAESSMATRDRIGVAVSALPAMRRWAALSTAIAAHRLASMIGVHSKLTRWWLSGTVQGLRPDIEAAQKAHYCAMVKGAGALDGVLAAL
jgi:hypothetical protein